MTKRAVHIYDTTLRDGTQGEGVSLSLQDKLNIAERLAEFGIDMIEGGYPLSNEKDAMFFRRVKQLNLGNSLVSAFGMTRRRGLAASDDPGMKALVAAETPVITVVGKSWDFHATEVLGVSLQENLDMIGESVEFLDAIPKSCTMQNIFSMATKQIVTTRSRRSRPLPKRGEVDRLLRHKRRNLARRNLGYRRRCTCRPLSARCSAWHSLSQRR